MIWRMSEEDVLEETRKAYVEELTQVGGCGKCSHDDEVGGGSGGESGGDEGELHGDVCCDLNCACIWRIDCRRRRSESKKMK